MLSIISVLLSLVSVPLSASFRPDVKGHSMRCAVDAILKPYESQKLLSGTLLIRKSGKDQVWSIGLANDTQNEPNSTKTIFLIASLSKGFVAASILKLEEAGELHLTDTLHTFLPEYPRKNLMRGGHDVALNDLLTHTSGMPEAYDTEYVEKNIDRVPLTFHQMISPIENTPLKFIPGTQFNYLNTGYMVLGEVIRRVSGISYTAFLNTNFLEPLGLNFTFVGPPKDPQHLSRVARCYELGAKGRVDYEAKNGLSYLAASEVYTDTDIYTDAPDLATWANAVTSGGVLSQSSVSQMLTPHLDDYGFGWFVFKDQKGRTAYEHSGQYDDFQSWVRRYPDDDVTVVWLSNQYLPEKKLSSFFESVAQAAFSDSSPM
jgi:CubicO group peptidase (beta-lactamase class C family)